MDAAKASAAMIGAIKSGNLSHNLDSKEALLWPVNDLKKMLSAGKFPQESAQNIPPLICIPTTAGTGSESGKSSVIADLNGVKSVLGHPSFMPTFVVLGKKKKICKKKNKHLIKFLFFFFNRSKIYLLDASISHFCNCKKIRKIKFYF